MLPAFVLFEAAAVTLNFFVVRAGVFRDVYGISYLLFLFGAAIRYPILISGINKNTRALQHGC